MSVSTANDRNHNSAFLGLQPFLLGGFRLSLWTVFVNACTAPGAQYTLASLPVEGTFANLKAA